MLKKNKQTAKEMAIKTINALKDEHKFTITWAEINQYEAIVKAKNVEEARDKWESGKVKSTIIEADFQDDSLAIYDENGNVVGD